MAGRDIHVLAVDDSHLDRKVVERLLKSSSYKVTTVDSAFRALEVLGIVGTPVMINAFKINLIITDYCMPEMTGYDLLKKVKESSALKEIPVVIMSSENVAERITMCLAEGAKEFILKPLRVADVKRLRSHIKHEDGENSCLKRRSPSSNVPCVAADSTRLDDNNPPSPKRPRSANSTNGVAACDKIPKCSSDSLEPDNLGKSSNSDLEVSNKLTKVQDNKDSDLPSPMPGQTRAAEQTREAGLEATVVKKASPSCSSTLL